MKTIFVITLFPDLKPLSQKKVAGWFDNLHSAQKAVVNNHGGMDECLFDYACIEEIPSGVYSLPVNEYWYEWNDKEDLKTIDDRKFIPIDKPDSLKGLIAFWG